MNTKSMLNYLNKGNYSVTLNTYEKKLESEKHQALLSITLNSDNFSKDFVAKGKLEGESYTDISMGDIYFFKADNSYTIFVTLSGIHNEFEHIFYYIIENAPISIINKLKKYI